MEDINEATSYCHVPTKMSFIGLAYRIGHKTYFPTKQCDHLAYFEL